jgi:putative copper resistance protein D
MSSAPTSSAAPEAEAVRSGATFTTVTALAGAIAAVVAALVVGLSAAQALSLLGIPDPGVATTYGLPAVRALADLAAALTVGSLLFAAFLVPPQGNGLLDVGGYRAVHRASNFAVVWACCADLQVEQAVQAENHAQTGEDLGRVRQRQAGDAVEPLRVQHRVAAPGDVVDSGGDERDAVPFHQ